MLVREHVIHGNISLDMKIAVQAVFNLNSTLTHLAYGGDSYGRTTDRTTDRPTDH